MKYNMFISIILAIISFIVYKFHVFWLKNIKKELSSEEGTRLNKVQHWVIILGTAIFSVIYFLKSILN
jgi:hypothetical protein